MAVTSAFSAAQTLMAPPLLKSDAPLLISTEPSDDSTSMDPPPVAILPSTVRFCRLTAEIWPLVDFTLPDTAMLPASPPALSRMLPPKPDSTTPLNSDGAVFRRDIHMATGIRVPHSHTPRDGCRQIQIPCSAGRQGVCNAQFSVINSERHGAAVGASLGHCERAAA